MKLTYDSSTLKLSIFLNSFLPLAIGFVFAILIKNPYSILVVPYLISILINSSLVRKIWKGKSFSPLNKQSWGTIRGLPYWKLGSSVHFLTVISGLVLGAELTLLLVFNGFQINLLLLFAWIFLGPASAFFYGTIFQFVLFPFLIFSDLIKLFSNKKTVTPFFNLPTVILVTLATLSLLMIFLRVFLT